MQVKKLLLYAVVINTAEMRMCFCLNREVRFPIQLKTNRKTTVKYMYTSFVSLTVAVSHGVMNSLSSGV